jgi:hypothetical protein
MNRTNTSSSKIIEPQILIYDQHAHDISIDMKLERNAIRKLDYNIIPLMAIFYLLSFLVSATRSASNEIFNVLTS